MAMQAGRSGGKREWNFFAAVVFRRHVPLTAGQGPDAGIKIDGGFECETFVAENVGFAAMAGADDVVQPAPAVQRHGAVAVEAQPGVAIFEIDTVMHARCSLSEISRNKI